MTTGPSRKFGDICNEVQDITFSYSHNLQTTGIVVKVQMCSRARQLGPDCAINLLYYLEQVS